MVYLQKRFSSIFISVLFINSISLFWTCSSPQHNAGSEYFASIQSWHQKRIENLTSKTGWLNLAGLYWLKEGEHQAGADESNDLVFPKGKAPDFIGTFTLKDSVVYFEARPEAGVMHDSSVVTSIILWSAELEQPPVLSLGSLHWFVIKRDEGFAIRLRDYKHPAVKEFAGIETFPIDTTWRIEAGFERYDPPKMIDVPTVMNSIRRQPSYGALVFNLNDKPYRLDTTGELTDDELFVIFSDATNGEETYGAGRFLYVPTPGEDGKTVIDFNKAYNPPCAFTKFATCPLPPEQNHFATRVTAGEKKYSYAEH